MVRESLDGIWKFGFFDARYLEVKTPEDITRNNISLMDADVPGNAELVLEKVGVIPEIFYGNNIKNLRKYETFGWIYIKEFKALTHQDNQTVILRFEGVDCIADYWLNGIKIGASDNMMIEHKFDVTDYLNKSSNEKNTLVVILKPTVLEAAGKKYYPYMSALPTNFEQLRIRKAPHCFGWDIMPRAVSAGIWRSVYLEIHDENKIEELYINTSSANTDYAVMYAFFKVKVSKWHSGNFVLSIKGTCRGAEFEHSFELEFVAGNKRFSIQKPKLWWPRGYGDANLYNVRAELLDTGTGAVLDVYETTIGVRTVELERIEKSSTFEEGKFLFKVNGTPVMCKGTNWVPLDAFHSRDAAKYEKAMELVTEANCNIIRCWGGNVYEDHAFFDLCDKNGIMVWQDFTMACGAYPQDEDFYRIIAEEAESVIKKLRNHPSIITWCGDNECDYNYFNRNFDPAFNKITREVLPKVVFANDPYRSFIISSPYMTPQVFASKDSRLLTEDHLWGPRDYYKSRFYTESEANFVGETGYHGCPSLSSIKKFIEEQYIWPEPDRWKDNDQWLTHCTAPQGKGSAFSYRVELMANQIQELFGDIPDNIEDFILASQISQAEAKKFFIESTRMKKWKRSGVIWWNMLDGWPQFSDAVVDYYFTKKLAFYYIKRSQQDFCIMMDGRDAWYNKIIAANDTNGKLEGRFRVYDADTEEELASGVFSVNAGENATIGRIKNFIGLHRLFIIEWDIDGKKYANHYLSGYPPFSLNEYRGWLEKIALLPDGFDANAIGK